MPNSPPVLRGRFGYRDGVTNCGTEAALVGDVDVDHISARRGYNILRLRNEAFQARPVHLDQQILALDAERETSPVPNLPEAAGQDFGREDTQPHVLDSELSL